MKSLFFSSLLIACALTVNAQTDSIKSISSLKFSGYLEAYYSYDFGNPSNNTRPGFAYSHNRHNEVSLNLGFVKAAYEKDNVRANLALMTGSYANANLAPEPGVLKNIYEANIGIKVSKTIWVDAGIFASHIGFESAVGKDCWNLTRSILADNSPYYETGAKVSYSSDNDKLFISGLFLNGWQRIQRVDGNTSPAFGHQLTYKPSAKITLNSSSFIGTDTPDSSKRMRYFHNFYSIFQFNKRLGLTMGFDFGTQQKAKGSSEFNPWYSTVAILKYSISRNVNLAVRGEYYSDKNQVIIVTGTQNGFQAWGYSANLDYNISDNLVWRIEARGFNNRDQSFVDRENNPSSQNYFMTTSFALSF